MFDYDSSHQLGSLFDLFLDQYWSTRRLSSEILAREGKLTSLGVSSGDRVLLAHGGSLDFFADLLAVWRVGACAACIDPGLPVSQIQKISDFAEVKLALVGTDTKASLSLSTPIVDLSRESFTVTRRSYEPRSEADHEALILFTSGTTGLPKGVVLTFRALQTRFALNAERIGVSQLHTTLCPLPTHFGHGLIGNCLTPLFAGGQVVLAPNPTINHLSEFGMIIDQHRVNFLSSVPAFWNLVTELSSEPKGGSLKRVHIGSAPLSEKSWREVIRWAGVLEVSNMYGLTETANWVAGASATHYQPKDGLVGRLWGGECRVLTNDRGLDSHGEGEIFLKVPSVMMGYLKQQDLTQAVIKDGWLKTGDSGSIDESGTLTLKGRLKFEINRGGQKIQPEDVNLVLNKHPAIREAYTFGIPDQLLGEVVGVALSLEEGAELDIQELKAWCRGWLVKEKVPEKWFQVTEIPKTARGKVNKMKLIGLCLEGGNFREDNSDA